MVGTFLNFFSFQPVKITSEHMTAFEYLSLAKEMTTQLASYLIISTSNKIKR